MVEWLIHTPVLMSIIFYLFTNCPSLPLWCLLAKEKEPNDESARGLTLANLQENSCFHSAHPSEERSHHLPHRWSQSQAQKSSAPPCFQTAPLSSEKTASPRRYCSTLATENKYFFREVWRNMPNSMHFGNFLFRWAKRKQQQRKTPQKDPGTGEEKEWSWRCEARGKEGDF